MTKAECPRLRFRELVSFGRLHVVNVYGLFLEDCVAREGRSLDRPIFLGDRYWPIMRARVKTILHPQSYDRIVSLTKLASALDDHIQDRPNIGRRGCDHAKDIRPGGLM